MKLIFLMSLMSLTSLLMVSCGNPHISEKQPPQQMVSPIRPEDDSDRCGEQTQQQQQQQQQDIVLLKDEDVSKIAKCKGNEVALEKVDGQMNWRFDRPLKIWGTRMPVKGQAILQLINCKEEVLKEFSLNGSEERIGFSALNEEVCSVTLK